MSEATIDSTAAGQDPAYINRELSWLRFNERVLAEAENRRHPLLERLKYLAIFESNLDEFFMVRVSGYFEQIEQGLSEETPDGLNPEEQVQAILDAVKPLRDRAAKLWEEGFRASLERSRIRLRRPTELEEPVQEKLAEWFRREIFPLCTPLVLWPNASFPFLSNRSLNLAVVLNDESGERLARVKVPNGVPRLVPVPGLRGTFVWLEDLLAEHLDSLFPGMEIRASYRFRVIRDADIEIRELEASDLISMVEQTLQKRRFGDPVLLEVEEGMPEAWIKVLRRGLQLDPRDVLRVEGLIGLDGLWEIAGLDRPRLRYRPATPHNPTWTGSPEALFDTIRERDVLLHMPYDSFRAVETFVASAANDPKVVGIKQTLYRVGSASPIVESLLEASSRGKQVAAMVELKARFDESNNLVWSRALERAGVHVTYGFRDMKVHAKLCVVVRKEKDGLRTYTYIGTGNFNPNTARTYTDLGLFTSNPEVGEDVLQLFNYLTGYARPQSFSHILVAPIDVRDGILDRIEREIEICRQTGKGYLAFKVNSLVDPEVIQALYEASQAGVQVDLVVRGICCLRPGVKKQSENIRVVSVIGRYLEHSRIYYFGNGGKPECFVGSADLMRRNLDRRIEVLAPVRSRGQVSYLKGVVDACFKDNRQAWELRSNGTYRRVKPKAGDAEFVAQDAGFANPASEVM